MTAFNRTCRRREHSDPTAKYIDVGNVKESRRRGRKPKCQVVEGRDLIANAIEIIPGFPSLKSKSAVHTGRRQERRADVGSPDKARKRDTLSREQWRSNDAEQCRGERRSLCHEIGPVR